uniref:N(4)-(beta-N-acetylglucosaminyl)-L-asparaginase n=1 Tax=Aceria tosichella TaxID=561515 RepID=A0A6G1SLF5_9ACAR
MRAIIWFALAFLVSFSNARRLEPPIVINTWNFTSASSRAWQELSQHHSALDAIEFGCGQCEIDRCDGTVGWGGSPSETGETTLDAMIMDGETYDVGGVGGLRRVKGAISVARLVLERTDHTLLVGDMATEFAVGLGFKEEPLDSEESRRMHQEWLNNSCQPNYWKNVEPDPSKNCGPYHLKSIDKAHENRADFYRLTEQQNGNQDDEDMYERDIEPLPVGHDTIGMVAIDSQGRVASGTSTNGLRYKILGRVGDSPVPGAGSYAAKEAGAAAATGDGDVMMRFLLSYQAVENLRRGMTSSAAAEDVILRQTRRTGRPHPYAAVIVLSKDGSFGAACCGYKTFPFVVSDRREQVKTYVVQCVP